MVEKCGMGLARVQCPFFKGSSSNTIKCEGLIDCSSIVLTYASKKEKDRQMQIFCEKRYHNCEVNIMLMKKYEQ